MAKDVKISTPQEIVIGSSDPATSRAISRAVKAGKMRKLAPRLYSSNTTDPPGAIIKRNIYQVLSGLFPATVISHRSVFDNLAAVSDIFLTTTYSRKIPLPGVTINCLKGPPAQTEDPQVMGLYSSSLPRAFLENLQISRGAQQPKILLRVELEQRLDEYLKSKGEDGLQVLRSKAREIADPLGMAREFRELDKIISALLGSHRCDVLINPVARASASGRPYDVKRLELFNLLWAQLRTFTPPSRPDTTTTTAFQVRAFFDAYFSNFIEGTRFEVEEARVIAFENRIPKFRPEGRDIAGTFQLLRDKPQLARTPRSFEEFSETICRRHALILAAHPEKGPGRFKWVNNAAGSTSFVDKAQVLGTLAEGFKLLTSLDGGLNRAIFMMFMISEVHPFMDGNGRIARAMMNAELLVAGESPIIIVNQYRDDYLGALRKISRQSNPNVYIRMLDRAHQFTASIDYSTFESAFEQFKAANAFAEPGDGNLIVPV